MDFTNEAAVHDYLVRRGHVTAVDAICLEPLVGGVSSDVVRIIVKDQSFVLKQALPKLKVQEDWRADTSRNHTERCVMQAVRLHEPTFVPAICFVDDDEHLFAMEYVPGTPWKEELLQGRVDRNVAWTLGRFLARVHRRSARTSMELPQLLDKTLFYQLRIAPYFEFLTPRYPACREALDMVGARMMETARVLVHGDFSPKNILLRPVGASVQPVVLDWEVAHQGHPAFDVGFMLHHLLLKAIHGEDPGPFVEAAQIFYRAYFEEVGDVVPEAEFRGITLQTTGALMLARLDGKSPVTYLRPQEQVRARQMGQALLQGTQETLGDIPT